MFALKSKEVRNPQESIVDGLSDMPVNPNKESANEAELRRQMYERIAQGNALAEIEESGTRRWGSR